MPPRYGRDRSFISPMARMFHISLCGKLCRPPMRLFLARAVYVGAMAEWFDFDLVAKAARDRPVVSFVMIGPPELAREACRRCRICICWAQYRGKHYLDISNMPQLGSFRSTLEIIANWCEALTRSNSMSTPPPGCRLYRWHGPKCEKLNAPIALAEEQEDFVTRDRSNAGITAAAQRAHGIRGAPRLGCRARSPPHDSRS